jgi:hypothetical protein
VDKPLKDWTAKEIHEECKTHWSKYGAACPNCYFFDSDTAGCLVFNRIPFRWNLSGPSRFTKQEREDAKVLMRAFPGCYTVRRSGEGLYLETLFHCFCLDTSMFPSVRESESAELSEIAGCNDE